VKNLTTLNKLSENIKTLASIESSDYPFVSCYLNLEDKKIHYKEILNKETKLLRKILKGDQLLDFEDSIFDIEDWLDIHLHPDAKGVAIFARGRHGGKFLLPMQFAASVPSQVALYPTPNLYHLIALKDNYDSYIVLYSTKKRAWILEVSLGVATVQTWLGNPELYTRVRSEWGKLHYQVNHGSRGNRFYDEKISILHQLMMRNESMHLVLAGDPDIIKNISQQLPKELYSRVVDLIPSGDNSTKENIVKSTLASFIEYEEKDSQRIANVLIERLSEKNLAVAGSTRTMDALRWDEADILVMTVDYNPDPGWSCQSCKKISTQPPHSDICPRCHKNTVKPVDIKEAIIRMAEQNDVPIEVVEKSDALMSFGGVGCLLRYKGMALQKGNN
tara:strand:- start:15199 stop:16365 length:1167 start_codon:yes stop_codon:yes gene_type:complete